ncbi:hypothetical protein NE237_014923 [Protea cynaroides]|uniref:Retrotransposon gag domain-containing protein n=1 Tax=Protea cynaroides TaxID=273540 RepID=A0A9Q0KD11_9MAGN|nr:hypothetical protein NE237_014923 [Protea cynaroides]
MPKVDLYDGTTDPQLHLDNFSALMVLHRYDNTVLCRAFLSTLRGAGRLWFNSLPTNSIESFDQLSDCFFEHFQTQTAPKKTSANLISVKQRPEETICVYLSRFNREALEIKNISSEVKMTALQGDIKDKYLLKLIYKRPPLSFAELMNRAEKYATMNEALLLTYPKSGEKRKSEMEVVNKSPSETSKKQKTEQTGFLNRQVARVDFNWDQFTRLTV